MLLRTIRRFGTALLWIGAALVAIGAVLPMLAPNASARAASSTDATSASTSPESKPADQLLRDEAAAVRLRVEEFRERSRAEAGGVDAAFLCYAAGACCVLAGLVGRLASDRRERGVESG